jgi:excinuclease ABC subunit C
MDLLPHLTSVLDTLPQKPGCYLMKDAAAKVVYVGKAVNLRNRVRSYFHAAAEATPKTAQLVRVISDIEWIVVGSELEALILEMNLIKRYRPKYNVRLKDDKRYPYIKVHWAEAFPKVSVTRQMVQDGSRYFGPYTSVWAVHQTLDVLRKIFPYLTCDRVITGQDRRACLWYDLHLCNAPCIGAVAQAQYRATIDDLCRFLQGETEAVVARMKQEMAAASAEERYEKAGALRDQLLAIERVVEKQKIVSNERVDSDVIALARANGDACVQVFLIRNGRLIGREYFVLEGTQQTDEAEVMRQFLTQFYDESAHIPAQVLLPTEVEEARIIEEWLRSRRGGEKTELVVPRSGAGRELLAMAAENASETLTALRAQWAADRSRQVEALAELSQALGLAAPPARIECFDISNLQGTAITASMVVFEQGAPRKAHYRRFLIRSVAGQDDFASMREALARRFGRWRDSSGEALPIGRKPDASFSMVPDLVIVDGGRGQLAQAEAVLAEHGLSQRVALASLAKQHEEIFRPGRAESIYLPRNSQALYLVQRIRDEAHRFAVSHHREVRTRIGLASQLDAIPGIGPSRRKALLRVFGDLTAIRAATLAELAAVPGITEKLAVTIKERL